MKITIIDGFKVEIDFELDKQIKVADKDGYYYLDKDLKPHYVRYDEIIN
jgi:hypothetical protein